MSNPRQHPRPSQAHEGRGEIDPSEAAREQVAILAYELWESHGRPEGTDLEDWFRAERQLLARLKPLDFSVAFRVLANATAAQMSRPRERHRAGYRQSGAPTTRIRTDLRLAASPGGAIRHPILPSLDTVMRSDR